MDQNMGTAKWWHERGYDVPPKHIPGRQDHFIYGYDKVRARTGKDEVKKQRLYKRYAQRWNSKIEQEFSEFIYRTCEILLSTRLRGGLAVWRERVYQEILKGVYHMVDLYIKVYQPPDAENLYPFSHKVIKNRYGGTVTIYTVECGANWDGIRPEFSSYWDAHQYLMAYLIPPYFRDRLLELAINVREEGKYVFYENSAYTFKRHAGGDELPIGGIIRTYTVLRDV